MRNKIGIVIKKRLGLGIFATVLLILALFTATAAHAAADIYEPDNTPANAKTIYNALFSSSQVQQRSIHAAGDMDWAKFTLTATTPVTLSTNGPSGDTVMYLYGPNSSTKMVAYSDDGNGVNGLFSLIQRSLAPGTYYIKVIEYGNDGAIPSYTLTFSYPLMMTVCQAFPPTGSWKGEYFNNKTLSGSPVMTRNDGLAGTKASLLFDWGMGSPGSACGVPADNFSARWTVTTNLLAYGYYQFGVNINGGGFRLWVNNQLVIDEWHDHATLNVYTRFLTLPSGPVTVKMEYYHNTGAAVAKLGWAPLL